MAKINREGIELLKHFEGLRTTAYQDTGGVWTIGYGHTSKAGAPVVKKGMKITAQQAEAIFLRDLRGAENDVKRAVRVPLNDNQYSALVSFFYNLGAEQAGGSTLVRKLNAKDYRGAANEFPKWVNDNGKKLAGLVRRRAAERKLFLKAGSTSVAAKPTPGTPSTPSAENWLVRLLRYLFRGGK